MFNHFFLDLQHNPPCYIAKSSQDDRQRDHDHQLQVDNSHFPRVSKKVVRVDRCKISLVHVTIEWSDRRGDFSDWCRYIEDGLDFFRPAHIEISCDQQHLHVIHQDLVEYWMSIVRFRSSVNRRLDQNTDTHDNQQESYSDKVGLNILASITLKDTRTFEPRQARWAKYAVVTFFYCTESNSVTWFVHRQSDVFAETNILYFAWNKRIG